MSGHSLFIFIKKDGEYKENISDLSKFQKHPLLAFIAYNFILVGSPTSWRIFCKILYLCICIRTKMYTLQLLVYLQQLCQHSIT